MLKIDKIKKLFLIIILLTSLNVFAQTEKTVTLTVVGQGKTPEEAKQNALRSGIEQAFGAFISTSTEILNDELVKDEIVSVSNGNIQHFETSSESQLPNGTYATSLIATFSITKLVSYVEGKGVQVQFKGGEFAKNIALQELYEKNEILAWEKTKKIINEIMKKGFDYRIEVKSPIKASNNKFNIEIDVYISMNTNFNTAINLLQDFCKNVSLNENILEDYIRINKDVFPVIFPSNQINWNEYNKIVGNKRSVISKDIKAKSKIKLNKFYIRNKIVAKEILLTPWEFAKQAFFNFSINNGIEEINMTKILESKTIKINELDTKTLNNQDERIGYVISPTGSVWNLLSVCKGCESTIREGVIGKYEDFEFYNGNIFEKKLMEYITISIVEYKENPIKLSPIVNFIELNEFLHLNFKDTRDINEIRNITEYKIEPKY